jgi:hypothetical protein
MGALPTSVGLFLRTYSFCWQLPRTKARGYIWLSPLPPIPGGAEGVMPERRTWARVRNRFVGGRWDGPIQ